MAIYGANNQGLKDFDNNKQRIFKQDIEEIRSLRFIRTCGVYAELVLKKQDKRLSNNDWKVIAKKYDNRYSPNFVIKRLKRLMSLPEAKITANSAIVQHLVKLQLDGEKPFKLLQKVIQIAEDKQDPNALFKVADKLLQLNGYDVPKTRLTIKEEHKHSTIEYNRFKAENDKLKGEYKENEKTSKEVEFKEVAAEKYDTDDNDKGE